MYGVLNTLIIFMDDFHSWYHKYVKLNASDIWNENISKWAANSQSIPHATIVNFKVWHMWWWETFTLNYLSLFFALCDWWLSSNYRSCYLGGICTSHLIRFSIFVYMHISSWSVESLGQNFILLHRYLTG